MSEAVHGALLDVRHRHPIWGPRKLLAWLEARRPEIDWPAASSVGELLRREGLVRQRRRKPRREPHPGPPQLAAQTPNDLWSADLKGQLSKEVSRFGRIAGKEAWLAYRTQLLAAKRHGMVDAAAR